LPDGCYGNLSGLKPLWQIGGLDEVWQQDATPGARTLLWLNDLVAMAAKVGWFR
jgi:hypothetical protein